MLLHTPRLSLRPWQPADAPALWTLIDQNRARLQRNFPQTMRAITDADAARAFIDKRLSAWQAREAYQVSLWTREAGQLAGTISLFNLDWSVPRAEIAYMADAAHEGQGLLREGLAALLPWAFDELGLVRIYARVLPENLRSRGLVQRLGFQREGLMRHSFRAGDGELLDTELYGLLPDDLSASRT